MEYEIGTQYISRGKRKELNTVVDILYTYNHINELVKLRYVSEHNFLGQTVIDRDVSPTTIKMGLVT